VRTRLEVFRELPAHDEFRRQWNNLVERMEQPEVFYSWEWSAAVTRSFAEIRPLFCAMFRESVLCAVVALEQRASLSFLTAPTADYCDFVSAPSDRREFMERVFKELARLKLGSLKLSNIPAGSETTAILRTMAKTTGYLQFSRPAYSCSQLSFESSSQRAQAALVAHNSPKRTSRLSRLGKVNLEHHTDWQGFSGEFSNFVTAHVERFRSRGKISSLENPERRRFLQELGPLLSQQGNLRCSVLRLGGRPVAWHFGMTFHGKWFWYQPAFDLACDHASPGTYLLRAVICEAASSPEFHAVDLGLGEEPYKAQYANSAKHTLHFTLELSKLRLAKEISRYYAARAIKQSPKLESFARTAISSVAAFRERKELGLSHPRGTDE
jgi:CelD/BcsL family acetyltransferase involved in cellulose biosynthesis